MKMLTFNHKQIRAAVIKQYMQEAGYDRAVCLTCGNAGRALREAGVDTIVIGEKGDLSPNRWFSTAEIHKMFPDCFDATSGHLNAELMNRIALAYGDALGELESPVYVPSGSGECLVCLKLAYPHVHFIAEYDVDNEDLAKPTEYSGDAPLNRLVECLADEIRFGDPFD